ncbi:MAG: hypothetical protein NVSMB23_11320 [Myxococcales bacterium]
MRIAASLYRVITAGLFGAQLFFAAVAAQVVFSREVAARPHADPLRVQAADAIGAMLARLDAATLAGSAIAVLCAVLLARGGPQGVGRRTTGTSGMRAALLPLLAGACALCSAFGTTPAIHALRAAGRTAEPAFGRLHALSSSLLLVEMLLLLLASVRPIESALFPGPPSR